MSRKNRKTFRGGVHPPESKELSADRAIAPAPLPAEVAIPLVQHIGAPNEPLVSAGQSVTVGQKIGESSAFVSAPVHASASGRVKEIKEVTGFNGDPVPSVIITADPGQTPFPETQKSSPDGLTDDDVRSIAKEAGLVGMGGAAFPTHVKLSPPQDKRIDTVIVNGCECEPFLTCDYRLMIERPEELVEGLKLLMLAVGAKNGVIGVEANKTDAAKKLESAISGEAGLSVEVLEVKYPQGAEKQLIFAVTGRKVPPRKLPMEVGCLVQNVGTTIALYDAAAYGRPLVERVVTVTGPAVREPGNLLARIGTPASALIDACGGYVGDPSKIIIGGPMTGWSQGGSTSPVVKGTSGIVVLTADMVDVAEEHACVRCTQCVDVCPMSLMPNFIVEAVQDEEWEKAEMWGALDCFECGACSYVCPAYIPHVRYVRKAKAEIAALRR